MWLLDGAKLRALRKAKGYTLAQAARRTGLDERTLRDYEAARRSARPENVALLCKAYGCEQSAIVIGVAPEPRGRSRPLAQPPRASDVPPPKQVRKSRLAALVALAHGQPAPPPLVVDGEEVEALTVKRFQDVMTAFEPYEGARFYVRGVVEEQRGCAEREAKLLGARNGVAALFHLTFEVARGEKAGITVHTKVAADTVAMQKRLHAETTAVVRVIVVPEALRAKDGLTFFLRERPSPWGLVVEKVIDVPS